MKLIASIAFALALSMPTSPATSQTMPLATMTCKKFVDGPRDTTRLILAWLMGYLHEENEAAELDLSEMDDFGRKLATYCRRNPTQRLMTAVEKIPD